MPRLSKASAAVSPPMPAPTTTTFLDVFMATSHLAGNVLDGEPRVHCDFTPEAFTTAVQRGISAATKAAKSCDEPILDSKPSFFMLAIVSGDCSAALTAALSLSTTSTGTPAGAHIPAQNSSVSSSRPSSFMVGTSGKPGLRCGLVTASALILPSRMSGSTVAGVGQ